MPLSKDDVLPVIKSGKTTLVFLLVSLILLVGCVSESDKNPNNSDDLNKRPGDGDITSSIDGDVSSEMPDTAFEGNTVSCQRTFECPENFICNLETLICEAKSSTPKCKKDQECPQKPFISYCTDEGECRAKSCSGDAECPDSYVCVAAICKTIPDCSEISDIYILPIIPLLKQGQTKQLTAAVVDNTQIPVYTDKILWRSMNPEVVKVEKTTGMIEGGNVSGITSIIAEFTDGETSCFNTTISVQNFATKESDLRVVVVDTESGETLGGVTVMANGKTSVTSMDGEKGVVNFTEIEAPFDIHVFHEDYNLISVIGVEVDDVMIPIDTYQDNKNAAGIKAQIDYSYMPNILEKGLIFGLMGLSFPQNVLDLDVEDFFSGMLHSSMPEPFGDFIFPSNIKISFTETEASDWLVEGKEGNRLAWAIGGYLDDSDLISVVLDTVTHGMNIATAIVMYSLGKSGSFYHGYQPDIPVKAHPKVLDNGRYNPAPYDHFDINGNGEHDDLVPSYDDFDKLENDLVLSLNMNNRTRVTSGKLPKLGSTEIDGLFSVVGTYSDDRQFMPLGIATKIIDKGGLVDKPSAGTGGDLWISYAPTDGKLSQKYTIITYAFSTSLLFQFDRNVMPYSVLVKEIDNPVESVQLGDYLPFADLVHIDKDVREILIVPNEQSNLFKVTFNNGGQNWDVFVNGNVDLETTLKAKLPVPPGRDSFGLDFRATAINLKENIGLDSFIGFNQLSMTDISQYISRYSTVNYTNNSR